MNSALRIVLTHISTCEHIRNGEDSSILLFQRIRLAHFLDPDTQLIDNADPIEVPRGPVDCSWLPYASLLPAWSAVLWLVEALARAPAVLTGSGVAPHPWKPELRLTPLRLPGLFHGCVYRLLRPTQIRVARISNPIRSIPQRAKYLYANAATLTLGCSCNVAPCARERAPGWFGKFAYPMLATLYGPSTTKPRKVFYVRVK